VTAEKDRSTHHGPVFGDHVTFIVGDGNGVGGRNDPVAPKPTGGWERHGKAIVGVAKARMQYKQDADTDMFVATAMLSSSAGHSAMHSDSGAGDETGAYDRCRRYRLSGKPTLPSALVYAGAQYCFTSSENHPGWFQVVNQLGASYLCKVVIWSD